MTLANSGGDVSCFDFRIRRLALNKRVLGEWDIPAEKQMFGIQLSLQIQWAISECSCASVSKRVYVRNLSYQNEFCMQFHFHANQSHFHKNGFALWLALKQRHKGTRKWPILFWIANVFFTCLLISSTSFLEMGYLTITPVTLQGEGSDCFSMIQLVGQKKQ